MSKTKGRRMELNTAELEDPQRREGERSEPDRSEGASNSGGSPMAVPRPSIPDSEVPAKPKRRRFTADYKRSIVEQADAGLYTHGYLIGSGETGGRSVRQSQ